MSVLTRPVSGRCQDEAMCQIWWESVERFGSYSSFCKFQNGGRRTYFFQISRFPVVGLLRVRRWCCVSNLVQIGLTVQKLLTFFFPILNALRVPQNWGFWGFRGESLKFNFSRPQKALPYAEARLLTYSAWKLVRRCGLYPSSRTPPPKKKNILGAYFRYMPGKTHPADFY